MTETEKIDRIDARILKELLIDGRKDFREIASKSNVTQNVIWQHYTNLMKKGIIVGSTIQLNYKSLGYDGAASFFIDVPPQELNETVQRIRKIPGLYDAYPCGPSRLWAVSDFMKTDQIDQVKLLINRIPSVLRLQIEIWTDNRNIPENLSIFDEPSIPKERTAKDANLPKSLDIDDIDWHMIEKLKENGRVSFKKIGGELGISVSTVIRRYNALKSGGILKSVIQLDPVKIGYFSEAYFRLKIDSKNDIVTISDEICKIQDVTAVARTLGKYDLTVFVQVKSLEHFLNIGTRIANVNGINEMDTPSLSQFHVFPNPSEHMSTF